MSFNKVYILARNLQSARNIARQVKNLVVYSGNLVSSVKPEHGCYKYSFDKKVE